jgi:DNA helicase-2/ATP-dependent DNA helicase PcrA
MTIAPSTVAPAADGLLASLDAEQRAAATLPDGPAQVIAPAGSGKTTTLIARLGVLLGRGVVADRIGVVTFNRDAAAELAARISSRLAPDVPGAEAIEVRTLHAMARQVLIDAGRPVRLASDRLPLLRAARRRALAERPPDADGNDPPPQPPDPAALDTIISAWKVEGRPPPPAAASAVRAFSALMDARGLIDFDDLVVGAVAALEEDPQLRSRWQDRFSHLCIDEFQDVDAAQLRLVRILAAPEDNLFVVGDDDQSIYGWRLADVRRVLNLAGSLPALRRIDLVTNYRCPKPVVERAVRLVAVNRERFAKRIEPRPVAAGRLVLAPDGRDDAVRLRRVLIAFGPDDGTTRAVLARTNRELLPAAAAALALGISFRAVGLTLLVESPLADELIAAAPRDRPPLVALGAVVAWERRRLGTATPDEDSDDPLADRLSIARALLAWCVPYPDLRAFAAAISETRRRLAELRQDDAALTLATAHGTKGLEFDHVAVIGLEDGRFPSARALADAPEPDRALEEERRLAYVAWTRARRSLSLVYDPAAPSRFLLEAFSAAELGLPTPGEITRPGAGAAR